MMFGRWFKKECEPIQQTPKYNKCHCVICLKKFLQYVGAPRQCPFCGNIDIAETDCVEKVGEKVAFPNQPNFFYSVDFGFDSDTTVLLGYRVLNSSIRPAIILPDKECANCGNAYDLLWFTRQTKPEKLSCACHKRHVCLHDVCSKWVMK